MHLGFVCFRIHGVMLCDWVGFARLRAMLFMLYFCLFFVCCHGFDLHFSWRVVGVGMARDRENLCMNVVMLFICLL